MNEHTTVTDDDLWGVPPAPQPAAESVDGEPPQSHRGRRWIAVAGALAVGVGALVGANIASSGTQNLGTSGPGGGGGPGGFGGPGGRGGGNAGTIASIDGSSLTMTTLDGTTVAVTTSASTTVTVSSTGQLSDVRVGDNVRVNGILSGTTIAAEAITDSGTSPVADLPGGGGPGGGGFPGANGGPPPAGAGRTQNGAGAAGGAANGTAPANGAQPPAGDRGFRGGGPGTTGVVKTVGNGTFMVTAADGSTVTVTTTSATTVVLVKPSTFSALKVGDQIQVNGTPGSDGSIAAATIRAGALPVRN